MFLKKYIHDSLFRNSISMMLNSAFMAFFGVLFWIIAARNMPSADVGLATAAISACGLIIGLSKFGMDAGLVRYLPESENKKDLYSTVFIVMLALSLIFAVVFIAGINIFSPALSFLGNGLFLLLFFAYITVTSIYTIQNIALITIRRADLSLIQNILLGLRIPILLLISYLSTFGVFIALIIAFIITISFGAFILRKSDLSLTLKFDIAAMREIFKFSIGNYTASIILILPNTIIPLMILNTIGAKEAAYFFVAYSLAGLLNNIPSAVAMSLFVEGSHNFPLRENAIKSIKLIMLFLIPALVFILFFGDKLLLLFSEEYSTKSFDILRLLALSSIFSSVIFVYSSIKKVQKHMKILNFINSALSVLLIGLGYLFILKYGLIGIGYAWFGANAIIFSFIIVMVLMRDRWVNSLKDLSIW